MPSQPDPALLIGFDPLESLGSLVADWVAWHCIVPDGWDKGQPFEMYEWQLVATVNHYRVRPDAEVGQKSTAFVNRRSQVVAPQKTGKGPWAATLIAAEAVGPVLFDGWAAPGEMYVCREHGCPCDFVYAYDAGEAKGRPWPTPLVQLLATSEDQVDNVYRPLQAMARAEGLRALMRVGEEFIRLPNDGRIDVVTASAQSRLGNPVTFALMDETGLYTKQNRLVRVAETVRRGLAGMSGRSVETTNAWDPSEDSTAQRTAESLRPDLYRFHRLPPARLSYGNKRERERIHRFVYRGSEHVDLDAIEAEAAELLERDPAQAERFFGNRLVRGAGSWLADGLWEATADDVQVEPGSPVCGGFDGSDVNDWSAIRLETLDGFQFTPTYGPDDRPTVWNPEEWGGRIPRTEVEAAWVELADRYRLVRVYYDPPRWETDGENWQREFGSPPFMPWETYRTKQMHAALERMVTDLAERRLTHDRCPHTAAHVGNARKAAARAERYLLSKPSPNQKIDAAMSSALAHEAACDAAMAGEGEDVDSRVVVFR